MAVGVVTSSSADTVSTVTDSASNTYAKVASVATQSISDAELWKSCITTAGTLTVTVTVSASSTFDIILYDVSSSHCRTMLSSTGTSTGATASAVTSYSPPKNSMIIGVLGSACVSTCAVTAGSGYTLDNNVAVGSTQASSESKLEASASETTPLSMNASSAYNEVSMQVPPTEFSNTFKASYPDGSPSTGAPAFCLQNGVLATLGDLTTAGVSGYCDYGSVAYAQAFAPGGSSTQQYSAVPLTQGLVGSWLTGLPSSLAGSTCTGATVYDLSHNNNTGTCNGSPTYVNGPFTGSAALNFSTDKTQYVSIPNSESLNPTTAITFSLDFNYTGKAVVQCLEDKNFGSIGGTQMYVTSSGTVDFNAGTNYAFIASTKTLTAGDYTVITGEASSSGLELFFNGTLVVSSTTQIPTLTSNTDPQIIGSCEGGNDPADGRILWAKMWDVLLPKSQISELNSFTSQQTMQNLITSPSNTYTFDYYHQYAEAPYYTAVSGTPSGDALNYYYSDTGTPLTDTMGTSPATIWADASTTTTGDHYVSSTERYSSNANTTLSSASLTEPKISIYHQYDQPTKIAYPDGGSSTSVALTCTQYGANAPTTLATSSQNIWADSGGTCSVPATTTISAGVSRLSMGPTYSWTISASGSVPSTLNGYLQYYLTNTVNLSVSGDSNGTSYQTSSSAYFDATTFTVTGHVITVSYNPQHQEWLYEVNQVYPMLLSAQPSVAPTMTQLQIGWTSDCTSGCYFTLPSSTNNVFSSLTDNGVSITPNAIAIAGGTTYTFSGASPWLLTMTSNSLPPPSGGGGSSTPPPSCPTGELYDTSTGACITVTGTQTIYQAPPTGNFSQVVIGLGVVGALLVLVVGAILIDGSSKTGKKRTSSQPKVKRKELW